MRALHSWVGRGQHTWGAWLGASRVAVCLCRSRERQQGLSLTSPTVPRAHMRISRHQGSDLRTIGDRCCLCCVLVLRSLA